MNPKVHRRVACQRKRRLVGSDRPAGVLHISVVNLSLILVTSVKEM
jgi:hypothetical protein